MSSGNEDSSGLTPPRILALNASPRRDGNSSLMLAAAVEGALSAGSEVESMFLGDWVTGVLDDCRSCRNSAGDCTIADRYEALLLEQFTPADGVLIAAPLHYYGMPSRLKAFFDRLFCYTSTSSPYADEVQAGLPGKRIGLLISSEETYPAASLGLVNEFHELARYNGQQLVAVVRGHGNSRGDVIDDPRRPLEQARELGQSLMTALATDYRFDTERPNSLWA